MVTRISVAIKTWDRGEDNYLGETVINLERSGVLDSAHLAAPILLVDSGSRDPDEFVHRELARCSRRDVFGLNSEKRTLHQNAAAAIRLASMRDADYVLVLEDDLDFCSRFLESVASWLEDHFNPAFPMFVFGANYDPIAESCRRLKTSWKYPVSIFYGAQALVWKTKVAVQLAEWLGPDPSYGLKQTRDHGHDLLLQRWGASLGASCFLASAPSFVQHVGRRSGIGNRFFTFSSWPGRKWSYERRT